MNGHIDLLDLPHSEARRLLRTGAPVYLTVNPVEYHGPHLSLHNDRLVSLGLVHALHQRLAARHPEWPLLLAHDLEVGVDPCFGPGSRHGSYAQTSALVRESCRALAELGAERVVIMTFHGAPLHNLAIEDGIQLLARRGVPAVAPFNLVLAELTNPRLDPRRFAEAFAHIEDARERDAMIRGLAFDFHAGFFETSMALHYAPESVASDHVRLPPCASFAPDRLTRAAGLLARALGRDALASELDFAASGLGWFRLSPFPNARCDTVHRRCGVRPLPIALPSMCAHPSRGGSTIGPSSVCASFVSRRRSAHASAPTIARLPAKIADPTRMFVVSKVPGCPVFVRLLSVRSSAASIWISAGTA